MNDSEETAVPSEFFIDRREVWDRDGLGRRERRWVTLAVVAFDNEAELLREQVSAALRSGDIRVEELLEFVLHFAVYSGWPKASRLEGAVRDQWRAIQIERGENEDSGWGTLDNETLGTTDWEARLARGKQEFKDVNLISSGPPDTPFQHAGILAFVFGHIWQRPGLSRRDRRFITVPCVVLSEAAVPTWAHIGSALHSGDVTSAEMDEVVVQFTAYAGMRRGLMMREAVTEDELGKRLNAH